MHGPLNIKITTVNFYKILLLLQLVSYRLNAASICNLTVGIILTKMWIIFMTYLWLWTQNSHVMQCNKVKVYFVRFRSFTSLLRIFSLSVFVCYMFIAFVLRDLLVQFHPGSRCVVLYILVSKFTKQLIWTLLHLCSMYWLLPWTPEAIRITNSPKDLCKFQIRNRRL